MRTAPTTYNFADLWEGVAEAVPDRVAVTCGDDRRTYAELDHRATRLAAWMAEQGVAKDDFIGIVMRNGVEYVETLLAAYKLRAVPVNVNYRYLADELRAIFDDAGVVGVVHDPDDADRVKEACDAVAVPWSLERGSSYEAAVQSSSSAPPFSARSGDDLYVLYTGGTTGQPKGVVWRMEDAFFSCIGGGDPTGELGPVPAPSHVLERLGRPVTFLPAAPLVHAAGVWTTLRWLFAGGTVVLLPRFAPGEVWQAVAHHGVNVMNIVGDAMAGPLLEALPDPGTVDLSSLKTVASGGASLSPAMRRDLVLALPWLTVKDTFGSSETGVHGWSVYTAGADPAAPFFVRNTVVLDPDTLDPLEPGNDRHGIIARRGAIPLRYHRDPEKSAATFRVIDGVRHVLTGDLGKVTADGRIIVLGRGSQCINTGGEKVYPDEVENVLRQHPGVSDTVVVGSPDSRWGQRVVALVTPVSGRAVDEAALRTHCRDQLASYKVPKQVVFVDSVPRSPSGKPDLRWATAVASGEGD
ncbi:AMP-binding protein [Haloechinothrix sp. YIM 98757]|uniref:AMP-binding protein n=1 Tax=Haloechinothrix aidingensis TaxID=2752311 RepID=A0A838AC88_9PSEU|nr:AMP-binding protein [Haloechinothrix aidingensis]MBA0126788.1 AMP-binding protein [Haloechinothrix aidingensis]